MFIKYFLASFVSIFIDAGLAWIFYIGLERSLVFSNTLGLIAGFLFTFLASKIVFEKKYSLRGFLVYLISFIFGMILANVTIAFSNSFFLPLVGKEFSFLLSKGLSIAVPFFFMYFFRKALL